MQQQEASINNITMRRFKSGLDFIGRFTDVFRGPTFIMTFLRVDRKLREKIMLAVSVANNCHT